MEAVKKMLPYVKRYVLLAIYDVLDKEGCIYELKEAKVEAEICVYDNTSLFSLSVAEGSLGTELTVEIIRPRPQLSPDGRHSAISAVADRIIQYLENELLMGRRKSFKPSTAIDTGDVAQA